MTEENQQAGTNDTDDQSKLSKFTVDLSRGLQRRIKLAASQNGLSMSEYVERVLDKAVSSDTDVTKQVGHPVTREAIERLRHLRQRIWEENNRQFFEDSTELIRQMRGYET